MSECVYTCSSTGRYCCPRCRRHWCFQVSCSSPHSSFWTSIGASSTSATERLLITHSWDYSSFFIDIVYQRMMLAHVGHVPPTNYLQKQNAEVKAGKLRIHGAPSINILDEWHTSIQHFRNGLQYTTVLHHSRTIPRYSVLWEHISL